MRGLWSVARHTMRQCLRMRAVAVFGVMLAMLLAAMPFVLKGDGSLAGRIRTFLSYSTALVATALGILTVFFSVAVISEDVRTKHIFSVSVKPVSRWQYLLGCWLGISMLNAILLVGAGTGIYALATALRVEASQAAVSPADRAAVETEVFTARASVSPVPQPIDYLTDLEIVQMPAEVLQERLDSYATLYGEEAAEQMLYADVRARVEARLQSVGPGGDLAWQFEEVNVVGREIAATGVVERMLPETRDEDGELVRPAVMRLEVGRDVTGRLMVGWPVRIDGVDAWVGELTKTTATVEFLADEQRPPDIEAGQTVSVLVDPVIQLTFEATASAYPEDGLLHARWLFVNPATGDRVVIPRSDPPGKPATLAVSSRLVGRVVSARRWWAHRTEELMAERGLDEAEARAIAIQEPLPSLDDAPARFVTDAVLVGYLNLTPPGPRGRSVTILEQDISVLVQVGGFEMNFLRGLMLMEIRLMYLAALGILAGSFLTFPVGCLAVFTLLPFSLSRAYLLDAVDMLHAEDSGLYLQLGRWLIKGVVHFVPDLEAASAGAFLVDGMVMSWRLIGTELLLTLGVHSAALLAMGCWIFTRRELARVQV